jgi:phosphoribosylformylglycinamidine synthase
VGDPITEKLLLEACLELVKTDALVAMQDMGAAGLTCSSCEMPAKGNTGFEIDVARVPRRETGMIPYEVMLSESQERMLIVVKKGKEKIVEDIFEKWDLHAVPIGEVKEGPLMRVFDQGELVAEIPAKALADEAPVYIRQEKRPDYLNEAQQLDLAKIPEPKNYTDVLTRLLDYPSIASKEWVYRQYDHMVRTDTVFLPGHDAALIRIKGSQKGIAVSTDCNSLYCYLDPFEGGKIAVAEAARNVAVSGARPVGLTNCLNFGNPMKPEIFWQFRQCVLGISEAARKFHTPVTGGNVSFYNENPRGAIYPTPTIGMVGILDNIEDRIPSFFQNEGDLIFLLGDTANEIGGSAYLYVIHSLKKGLPPRLDLEKESALITFFEEAAKNRILRSAHDLSEGGLAVAIAECCFNVGARLPAGQAGLPRPLGGETPPLHLGAQISNLELLDSGLRTDSILFSESQSRVLVSANPAQKEAVIKLAQKHRVPVYQIGKVIQDKMIIEGLIDLKVKEAEEIWRNAIGKRIH